MLYIVYEEICSTGYEGVKKKIESQCSEFCRAVEGTYLVWMSFGIAYISDCHEVLEKKPAVSSRQYLNSIIQWLIEYDVHNTYIRNPFICDVYFIELLRYLDNKGIKTLIEIPTYPYEGEMLNNPNRREDSLYRKQMSNYSCCIAASSEKRSIWGIPVIKVSNGIDVSRIRISHRQICNNEIVLIAVASSFMWWQGFERLLAGIRDYKRKENKEYNIKFILVGSGGDEEKYRKLAKNYDIDTDVIFWGKIDVDRIDSVLGMADIAISCLGIHRKLMRSVEPIKVGEYCAKGLPMVCAYDDPRFPKYYPYICKVPADESAINVDDLIAFWNKVTEDIHYKEKIRKYAEDNLGWDSTMRNAVKFFTDSI